MGKRDKHVAGPAAITYLVFGLIGQAAAISLSDTDKDLKDNLKALEMLFGPGRDHCVAHERRLARKNKQ